MLVTSLFLLKAAVIAAVADPGPPSWQLRPGEAVALGLGLAAAVVAAAGLLQPAVQ